MTEAREATAPILRAVIRRSAAGAVEADYEPCARAIAASKRAAARAVRFMERLFSGRERLCMPTGFCLHFAFIGIRDGCRYCRSTASWAGRDSALPTHLLPTHEESLFPAAEVDGRKGIFVERELYTQLSFFKDAGERFARNREKGLRYSEIMKECPQPGGTLHEEGQATRFMPFAGTEGYNPVAYAPYTLWRQIGNLLGLDFPKLLY